MTDETARLIQAVAEINERLRVCQDALLGAQEEKRVAVAAERERCARTAAEYPSLTHCAANFTIGSGVCDCAESIASRISSGVASDAEEHLKAVAVERERCAKIAEEFESDMGHGIPQQIADRIRSGE